MIKVIEKDFLDDKFINKTFVSSISLQDNIYFSHNDIYYFGNYAEDKICLIKKKLLKNKKRFINAVENGVKFIISGSSMEMFNNSFKHDDLNIFTIYSPFRFKRIFTKLVIKNDKKSIILKHINSLKKGLVGNNFRYKNLICISDEKLINKIIKKTKQTTLSC